MRRRVLSAGLAPVAGAALLVLAAVSPASAATAVPVTFDCQAKPPVGDPQQLTLSSSIQADAPEVVTTGDGFEVTLAADPLTVPAQAGGYTVNNLRDLTLKVPVPEGSTYQSATLTGGSNLGTGTPSVAQADNVVTVTVPGPLAGGSTFQLPALHLGLTATGPAGSTIETSLAGTGYADPGMTFTANVKVSFFNVDVPASCYANPSPTLTSTAVTDPAPTDPAPTDPGPAAPAAVS